AQLVRQVGGSSFHLQRNFTRIVGISPRAYAEACRMDRVKRRLRTGAQVTTAIFDAGYQSSSRFYEHAAKRLGMTPATYQRGGRGATIWFAVVDSPLGRLLVGATSRGVCAVAMGASQAELRRVLADEYPAATLVHDPARLDPWLRQLLEHLEGRRPHLA